MNTAPVNPLLQVDDLVVEYGRGRHAFRALHGVSLDIAPVSAWAWSASPDPGSRRSARPSSASPR